MISPRFFDVPFENGSANSYAARGDPHPKWELAMPTTMRNDNILSRAGHVERGPARGRKHSPPHRILSKFM